MLPNNSQVSPLWGKTSFDGFPSASGNPFRASSALFGGKTPDGAYGASSSSPAFGCPIGPRLGGFGEASTGVPGASSSKTSSSLFGPSVPVSSGLFGPSGFGTSTGVPGASSSTTSSSLFGPSMPASSGLIGSSGSSSSAISSSLFGNQHASPFGNQHASPFGNQHASPFGNQHASPFSNQHASPFGSTIPASGITSTCGNQHASPFGDTRPSSPFGDTRPASPFGDTRPASPFGDTRPAFGVTSTCGNQHASPFVDTRPAFGAPSTFGSASTQSGMFSIPSTDIFGQPCYYVFTQPQISIPGYQLVSEPPQVLGRNVGSRKAPYSRTREINQDQQVGLGYVISISSMPIYCDKSHEELRWEDKVAGPYPTTQFCTPNPFAYNQCWYNSMSPAVSPSFPPPLFCKPNPFAPTTTANIQPTSLVYRPITTTANPFNQPTSLFYKPSTTTANPFYQPTSIFYKPSTPFVFPHSQPVPTSQTSPTFSFGPTPSQTSPSIFNTTVNFPPSTKPSSFSFSTPKQTFPTNSFEGCRIGSTYYGETAVNDEKPLSVSVDCGKSHEELRWEKKDEDSASHEKLKKGEDSVRAFCVSVSNLDANEAEDDEIVSKLMPKLHKNTEYYTEPKIEELERMERTEPGSITRVKDFVIGRRGFGSIKFVGPADICQLDLEAMIEFNHMEVIVYKNGSSEGMDTEAEVTLLNVKCFDKITGEQCVEGAKVERYRNLLMKKAVSLGIEVVSYDPVEGVWKFKVPKLSVLISS